MTDREALPAPGSLAPMLATLSRALPGGASDAWAYEMKWDGVRALLHLDGTGGGVRVVSRSLRDVTATYPELAGLGAALAGTPCVLDGELVALDPRGRPSFAALQHRMHVLRPAAALVQDVPVTLLAFDVLHLSGRSLRPLPYDRRREVLEGLLADGACWAVPPAFAGDADAALATSRAQGLEGVVAKRRDSAYAPGRRSRAWLKVKHVLTQDVVVGGWRPGEGSRAGGIGSLLVGIPRPGGLAYAGRVGTGLDRRALADLGRRLAALAASASPFTPPVPREVARDARWVRPVLVAEVVYGERTPDGLLRHPVWRGLRPDLTPADVAADEAP